MATLKTYTQVGIKEDLDNLMYQLQREETPIVSRAKKVKATSTKHEWLSRSRPTPDANNAAIEGDDGTSATLTQPTRLDNYTQIFQRTVQVSGTSNAVNLAGRDSELADQIAEGMAIIKNDIESSFVSTNVKTAGDGSTARKLGGLQSYIKTYAAHGTDGATAGNGGAITDGTNRALTEAMLQTAIEGTWLGGGKATEIYASAVKVKKMAGFTGGATKMVDVADKTIFAGVDVYVSQYGKHAVIPHWIMSDEVVLVLDPSTIQQATLRPLTKNPLGKTGDSEKVQLVTETTLVVTSEKANAKIADLDNN